jgi:sugar phosphate isomerase/epimerase
MKFLKQTTFFAFVFTMLMACDSSNQADIQSAAVPATATKPALPQLSVQLWSVKDQVKQDIDATLAKISEMGFAGVEFAGEFGPYADDPAALKQKLASLNLKPSGAHVQIEVLSPASFEKTVAFYKELGVETLIIPWDERAWSPTGIDTVVNYLTEFSVKLSPHGMKIGFHNHDQEFNDYKGSTYWDYMAKNTPESVVMQQDVGWTTYAGKDPVEYVNRYPGRTLTTHYKVRLPEGTENKLPIIGQDTIDWLPLLTANAAVGGTKWIVIEQEEYPNGLTPLQAVKESLDGLKAVIARY